MARGVPAGEARRTIRLCMCVCVGAARSMFIIATVRSLSKNFKTDKCQLLINTAIKVSNQTALCVFQLIKTGSSDRRVENKVIINDVEKKLYVKVCRRWTNLKKFEEQFLLTRRASDVGTRFEMNMYDRLSAFPTGWTGRRLFLRPIRQTVVYV